MNNIMHYSKVISKREFLFVALSLELLTECIVQDFVRFQYIYRSFY